MSYITKPEIEQHLGISIDVSLGTYISTLISMAEEYIEIFCGGGQIAKRKFEAPSPDNDTVRYYDGNDTTKLKIDDLRAITSLVVDGVSLVENEDYFLYPLNAPADGKPYEWIELVQPETRMGRYQNSRIESTAPYTFLCRQKNVVVTGKFGYSASVPSAVKVAAMKIVSSVIKENIGDDDLKTISSQSLGESSMTYETVTEAAKLMKVNEMLASFVRKSNAKKSGFVVAR